jgi:hypothetical protein
MYEYLPTSIYRNKDLLVSTEINTCYFVFSDEVPTVVLQRWPLACNFYDGDLLMGPVPTLFASIPDEAVRNLIANKEKV